MDKELLERVTVAVLILKHSSKYKETPGVFFQNFNLISSQLQSQDVYATNETF